MDASSPRRAGKGVARRRNARAKQDRAIDFTPRPAPDDLPGIRMVEQGQGTRPLAPLRPPGSDRPSRPERDRHVAEQGDGYVCCGVLACSLTGRAPPTATSRRATRGYGALASSWRPSRKAMQIDLGGRGCAGAVGSRCLRRRSAATCRAIFRRCERTRRPSSLALRRDPIRPRPASRIGSSRTHSLFRRENTRKRAATIWSARLLCSNPARTMIWPFRFGQDAGIAADMLQRSRHGRWDASGARYPLIDGAHERLAGVAAYRHAPVCEITRGDVRFDARRQGARRSGTVLRPPVSRVGMICRCGERTGVFRRQRRLNLARLARGSPTCAAASRACDSRTS